MADSTTSHLDVTTIWNFADPAGSEQRFAEAMAAARNKAVEQQLQHAELQTQLARAVGLQKRYDEADRLLDEAAEAVAALGDGADTTRIELRVLLERGRVRNSSGAAAESLPHFQRAFELGMTSGNIDLAIDAVHMLGIASEPEQQVEWNRRGLEIAEQSNDESVRRWISRINNNLGWTLFELGRYEHALEAFELAHVARAAEGVDRETQIAKWAVGRTLRALERHEDALQLQLELLDELETSGHTDGHVFEELGEIHKALGHHDEAEQFAGRARELLA